MSHPLTTRACLLALCLAFLYSCGDFTGSVTDPDTTKPDTTQPDKPTDPPTDTKPPKEEETADFLRTIPDGYELFKREEGDESQTVHADFNGDGIKDAATIISAQGRDFEEGTYLHTAISHDGKPFIKTQMSKNLGDVGTAPELLSVEGNVLILHHLWMRAVGQFKFRYEKSSNDFRIIGKEYEGFGNAVHDGAGKTSINFLTGKYTSTEQEAVMDDDGNVLSYVDKDKTGTVSTKLLSLSDMNEETWYVEWY